MSELYSFGQHGFKTSFGLLRYYFTDQQELRTNRVITLEESSVKPERGYKFINEFKITSNQNAHTITAYSNYIENYIFNRPYTVIGTIRGPMPVFIYDQTNAFFLGADYSWKRKWTNNLSGTFGVSYLWSRNLTDEESLINQPPVTVDYKLNWNLGKLWKFDSSQLTIKPSYTFHQFQAPRTVSPEELINGTITINPNAEIFDFKDAPDGYFLLNISWRFKWNNISGNITVDNLLNSSYRNYLNEMRYFADEPGRNFIINLSYNFNSKNKS